MSFLLFLVGFLEKWTKRENFRQLRGSFAVAKRPLTAAKIPTPQRGREGRLARSRVRRGVAQLCHNVVVLCRDEATVHSMEMLCFCFVLFFRCSEDLSIGLMRTL